MDGRDWADRLAAVAQRAAVLWQNGAPDSERRAVVRQAAAIRRLAVRELAIAFAPRISPAVSGEAVLWLARLPAVYARCSADHAVAAALVAAHRRFPAHTAAIHPAADTYNRAADAYVRLTVAMS